MYKFISILPLLFAAATAGIIGAPYSHGGLALAHSAPVLATPIVAHPIIAHPIVAHTPLATSYSNSYRVVHNSVPIVKTVVHEPLVAHGPLILHGLYHH